MTKKREDEGKNTLGQYLSDLREAKGLKLRQVEEATNKEVSNAYLSQLENDKIKKPSPNILYSLAAVYSASYETLMEKAGYIFPTGEGRKVPTRSIEDLSAEEEEALRTYLAFFRSRKRKNAKKR